MFVGSAGLVCGSPLLVGEFESTTATVPIARSGLYGLLLLVARRLFRWLGLWYSSLWVVRLSR